MNISDLIAKAESAFATMQENKYGSKSVTEVDGNVSVTISQSRDYFKRYNKKIQFKRDGKVISKAKLMNESVADINPELLIAFEAQAPKLSDEYAECMRKEFARIVSVYGDGWNNLSNKYSAIRKQLREIERQYGRDLCANKCGLDEIALSAVTSARYKLLREEQTAKFDKEQLERMHGFIVVASRIAINEEALKAEADKYGDETARQWFYKTNQKLGKLQDATVTEDRGGYLTVHGKKQGTEITLRQQRVTKWSEGCGFYHQFPARLYIEGKFYPEVEYGRKFGKE